MKKIILYILSVAAMFIFVSSHLFAQETRSFDFNDFTGVGVSWGMNVVISQSSEYKIEIEADKKDLDVLKVEKRKGSLEFFIDKNNYRKHGDIKIKIKMPALSAIELSGGSTGKITMDIASKDFSAELSGGAELEGQLTCGDINLELSGGATVKLNGKGENLTIDGSGGSVFKLKGFSINNLVSDLSGGSRVSITMDGGLSSSLSGGSEIVYYGSARMVKNDFDGGGGISKGKD